MYLIVGAGLAGSVMAERISSILKKEVLIVDKRSHIGGNTFDYRNDKKILIHKYGPHIFHTNSDKIWNYVNNFTTFEPYFHRVTAIVEGMNLPVPFNIRSLFMAFPNIIADKVLAELIAEYGFGSKVSILELMKSSNKHIEALGDYVYNNIFLQYTLKQWGLNPRDIDKSITARIPIYLSHDTRYFQDKFQGMPTNGYSSMIENMLDNSLIKVQLNSEYKDIDNLDSFEKIIFTGCIDEYYNYKYGELDYRSLKFDLMDRNVKKYQDTAQVNYPNNFNFTRITEPKHFYREAMEIVNYTSLQFEYPQVYRRGINEPYYPILNDQTNKLYKRYKKEASTDKSTIFLGRLAEFKYYNMDQVIGRSLSIFDTIKAIR
jgi:UDP-galactopyranose mutase